MKLDVNTLKDARVRTFYALYWPQHQIIVDFFTRLDETHYDTRLVDTPGRKSDSPRESLAHILYVQLVYLNGLKTGKLEYKSMGTEHFNRSSKTQLLAEMDRIDQDLADTLTADTFDSSASMEVFWGGQMNVLDVLFFLRDHDILHIGWNLTYMDMFDMPRYDSLIHYWG